MLVIFLLLGYIFTPTSSISNDYQLEFVSTVFRHGDRSPIMVYPTSEYQESFWPQGFGQLTIIGMQEEYHLGELYRNLYIDSGFLDKKYSRHQVYVRSTDYDRTLMSGESMLSALYPPDNDEKFKDDLPWHPIPVHTIPKSSDVLLRGPSVDCPEYQRQRDFDKFTEEYMEMEEKNKDLFRQLKEQTTVDYDISNVWSIADELFIERAHNLKMPSWYSDKLLYDQLLPLQYYGLTLFYNSDYKKKAVGGVWANEVLTNMIKKSQGSDDIKDLKVIFYSAHDTTVGSMLSVFNMYDGIQPPYSSAFTIELYSKDKEYFVGFRYRNDTFSDTFHDLEHPECSQDPCPLNELTRIMEPYLLTKNDTAAFCSSQSTESSSSSNLITALSVVTGVCGMLLVITLVVMVIVLVLSIRQKRKVNKYKKLSATEET